MRPLDALPLPELRERSSAKWRAYPDDVLPLFVAETDFALAPAITERLRRAVELGDTGYAARASGVREAYAGFAGRRFGWHPDPALMKTTCDVMMGVVEILRQVTRPGDRVVVMPPVYPPFFDAVAEAGAVVERVPLVIGAEGSEIDLDGVEAALVGGARAILLCHPHNPTGTVHAPAILRRLAELAAAHDAVVVSDEIHAPMAHPDAGFVPFLAVSDTASSVGFALVSASKAFNLAGLKCAIMVAGTAERSGTLRSLPVEVEWRTSIFGAHAAVAAFTHSDDWLDALLVRLDVNRRLLQGLLADHLPLARYRIPPAGFLGWVDLSAYGWGDDPGRRILRDARVAFHFGPQFGAEGRGHVRVNFGCDPEMLREAVARVGALAGA
ncbi:MalY/PatB family protein [Microbacterium invictum]|uniref:cysteine-S-conjugate beta-lyase n=1 Tax=Microbacterium invictum TaxID=515415 RepID=A0ABZ0V744_9MICO|nr:aminotransferase class I/II-fold pyridoxal phosphate-dependent enzyme [Microbacterium invictum]WQB69111.1 aminotransferase class I/II-fold pyridoxal phosphate-dependent enzyme [Microbacterium invictum]